MIRSFVLLCSFIIPSVCVYANEPCQLPTLETVGPWAMPSEVKLVQAPFPMTAITRPEFPDRKIDIVDLGAVQGLDHLVTEFIQNAIDKLSTQGGGKVIVSKGKWHTGRIQLKSNVNLHIEEGAELHFSGKIEDYLPPVFTRYECLDIMGLGGLIYALEQKNIAVTGKGVLIGPSSGPVREIQKGLTDDIINTDLPVAERIFDGQEGRHYFRPYFICPVSCQNVFIEGVSMEKSPMWNIVPIYCEDIIVRGVKINSEGIVNGDGVNLDSCRNALIEYCSVSTGDDCFTMKAGRNKDGHRIKRPTENVVLRYNHANGGFGGITCGSDTAGILRNIYTHDCVFNNVRHAAYFKTRRPRAGGGENIIIERIRFDSYHHAIMFDMLGAPIFVGELANRLPHRPLTDLTPYYRDVTLRQFIGRTKQHAFKIKGIPESPATRIRLEDSDIQSNGLIHLADVDNVKILNSKFTSTSSDIYLLDAKNIFMENVQFEARDGEINLSVNGPETKNLEFKNCEPESLGDLNK